MGAQKQNTFFHLSKQFSKSSGRYGISVGPNGGKKKRLYLLPPTFHILNIHYSKSWWHATWTNFWCKFCILFRKKQNSTYKSTFIEKISLKQDLKAKHFIIQSCTLPNPGALLKQYFTYCRRPPFIFFAAQPYSCKTLQVILIKANCTQMSRKKEMMQNLELWERAVSEHDLRDHVGSRWISRAPCCKIRTISISHHSTALSARVLFKGC